MKLEHRLYGNVKGGKVKFELPEYLDSILKQFESKRVEIKIKESKRNPSLNQYAYYYGIILPVCHKTEMFSSLDKPSDIHDEYFGPKFLSYRKLITINNKTKEVTRVRGLSELNIDEMSEFISRVMAECQNEGIDVPEAQKVVNRYYKDED